MNVLLQQHIHNTWANYQVLSAFRERPQLLDATMYDGDPLLERAMHLAVVERGFLHLLEGNMTQPEAPRELEELIAYSNETGEGFAAALSKLDDAAIARPAFVPWFQREFPTHVLIAQVLAHSGQHRAELAWELARAGVNAGEIDLIGWEAAGRPKPGEGGRLS
ncbi:MAG: DinB family protein [Hyphomicrobiales bacterium]